MPLLQSALLEANGSGGMLKLWVSEDRIWDRCEELTQLAARTPWPTSVCEISLRLHPLRRGFFLQFPLSHPPGQPPSVVRIPRPSATAPSLLPATHRQSCSSPVHTSVPSSHRQLCERPRLHRPGRQPSVGRIHLAHAPSSRPGQPRWWMCHPFVGRPAAKTRASETGDSPATASPPGGIPCGAARPNSRTETGGRPYR